MTQQDFLSSLAFGIDFLSDEIGIKISSIKIAPKGKKGKMLLEVKDSKGKKIDIYKVVSKIES